MIDVGDTDAADSWNLIVLFKALYEAPSYHLIVEAVLVALILWLVSINSYKPSKSQDLTEKEKDDLVEEWDPDPLVPELSPDDEGLCAFMATTVQGKVGKYVSVDDKKLLNLASLNFLDLVGKAEVEDSAVQTLRKYGVGSCGPRGFYGTVDVHLELEAQLARFMQCEEAVLYSYGFPTIASAIPAYSKRGDIIFVDEGVHFSVQQGLLASRSQLRYFRHNDMGHLRQLLEEQQEAEFKDPKKAKVTRKFMVVEGLYMNYGDICPLPELIALKYEFKVRLFVEESCSFGVLGSTGRGVTQHFDVSIDDVDLVAASLENALAGNGGFCCGKSYVIDHQRLSGQGYCFSASLPPMLATATSTSLRLMGEQPEMFQQLRSNAEYMHEKLESLSELTVEGNPISPIKHVRLTAPVEPREQQRLLQKIVTEVRQAGLLLTVARYLRPLEHSAPPPSLRLCVSCSLTTSEMVEAADTLAQAVRDL